MKKIILTTFLWYSSLLAQISFESAFDFISEFNNSQSLTFGYDPYGTNGFDPQLGETEIPQVPPGQFGVRFQLPTDTSIYTIKDIRLGCGQPFYYEYLIDLSYETGSNTINVFWGWEWPLMSILFKNPFNGDTLAQYEMFTDSTHFIIPPLLEKIAVYVGYDGPIGWPQYDLISPNGGDTLTAGQYHTISWMTNGWWLSSAKLEYSIDAGKNWTIITDSLPPPNPSYLWLIPTLSSDSCLVRVGDYPCYCDVSDSLFAIAYPVLVESESRFSVEFSLSQNYPNPFNPCTKIKYTIPSVTLRQAQSDILVTIKVYDVLGNEVATLVNEEKPAGEYEVEFNAASLPSGIYFYQFVARNYVQTRKMVILK
jgi:hypothetical protein